VERILPFLEGYADTAYKQRGKFVANVANELGQAENTVQRQLSALQYLSGHGVDVAALAERRPPPLLAVESVARVAKVDRSAEIDLLKRLLAGRDTVDFFVAAAKAARQKPDHDPKEALPTIALSSLLKAHLFPQGYKDPKGVEGEVVGFGFGISFPGQGRVRHKSPLPSAIIDQGQARRTAILVADCAGAAVQDPAFQLLIEGSALRSLVTCDRVVVCANLALQELERTVKVMKKEHRDRLHMIKCNVAFDLKPEDFWDGNATLDDYLQRRAVLAAR
jgi:hypothetical protein